MPDSVDGTHAKYIEVMRSISPEAKLIKVFEMQDLGTALAMQGLRNRNPEASEDEIHLMYFRLLDRCHNLNY
jgi:hypothetical protein